MSTLTYQSLNSTKYSESQGSLPCICCGLAYSGEGEYCLRCETPLELSRTVGARVTSPHFISVLGASGAGKTVYLGILMDILSKGRGTLRGQANGAFSVSVQEKTVTALESRRFPEKTPAESDGWRWVHCELSKIRNPKQVFDIITPDFAGEAIAQEIERPGTSLAIRRVIGQSQAILLLCDSQSVRDSGLAEDMFAIKVASYIFQEDALRSRHRRRQTTVPLAIVFSKCDFCREARQDPHGFAANNLPRLMQFCKRNFTRYQFFATSIVGSSAPLVDGYGRRMQVPFHVEPYGVTEPLEWIMQQN